MIRFRSATRADVPAIMALMRDDSLGQTRETADPVPYLAAFDAIAAQPMHHLIVGEINGRIVATCQLTILHGLSRNAMIRAQIEAVRTAPDQRSMGIGAALMAEAESRARAAGAQMIQLTTDKARPRAQSFYDQLGYTASHIGYKKTLT